MLIFPAIDLYHGQAVRLYRGDYTRKTVFSEDPLATAFEFAAKGARYIHMVDLEGAATGTTPNSELICNIKQKTGLFTQVGGGIRKMETIEYYLNRGIDRVILGTAALNDRPLLLEALYEYGDRIAVSVDIRDGRPAINGWKESSDMSAFDFCRWLTDIGVRTIICTDISRDGAMRGTNLELYRQLSMTFPIRIIASGGVSSLDDVIKLREMDLYGAIIGKACYTGAVDLKQAIEVAQ